MNLANGLATITNISGGTGPYVFTLNGVTSSDGFFGELPVGEYNLNISDANGCELDTSFSILPGLDLSLSLPPSLSIGENERGFLSGLTNVAVAELSAIQWSPADAVDCPTCLETSFTATSSQNLTLTIVHENGCLATAVVQLQVVPLPDVYIPNAFSPNQDGANDQFMIFANSSVVRVDELMIADRWGEIVYRQQDLLPGQTDRGWDGTFRGQDMNAGVYVYFIRVRLQNGEERTFKGDVTLIR